MTKTPFPPVAEFATLVVAGLIVLVGAVAFGLLDHAVPLDGGEGGHSSTFGLVVAGLGAVVGVAMVLVGLARLLRALQDFLVAWRASYLEPTGDRQA